MIIQVQVTGKALHVLKQELNILPAFFFGKRETSLLASLTDASMSGVAWLRDNDTVSRTF